MAEFKDRLRKLRKEKNLYQKELAEVIGVSDGAIGMYETGKRSPDKSVLDKLASYFEVSVDYLLGRTEERLTGDQIKNALADSSKTHNLLQELTEREDLQQLLRKTKNLKPEEVERIIKIINVIEDKAEEED